MATYTDLASWESARREAQAKWERSKNPRDRRALDAIRAAKPTGASSGGAPSSITISPDSLNPTVEGLRKKQADLIRLGDVRGAEKIGQQINDSMMKNPLNALPVAEEMANKEIRVEQDLNRVNQETIGGSRSYIRNPDGTTTVKDSLDPLQTKLLEEASAGRSAANQSFLSGLQSGNYGRRMDVSGLPSAPNSNDLLGERARIEDSIYKSQTRYLDQDYDRERKQIQQEMYETGNAPGTPQYEMAMQRLERKFGEAKAQARDQAIQQGGNEWQRSFNIGMTGRQNAFGENLSLQKQGFDELQGINSMGGGPVATPNFIGFQALDYNAPNVGEFVSSAIGAHQNAQDLRIKQQALARSGGGRSSGGGGGAPTPVFDNSYGINPASMPGQSAPNQTMVNFTNGLIAGGTAFR